MYFKGFPNSRFFAGGQGSHGFERDSCCFFHDVFRQVERNHFSRMIRLGSILPGPYQVISLKVRPGYGSLTKSCSVPLRKSRLRISYIVPFNSGEM